jgi:hypothetical protein
MNEGINIKKKLEVHLLLFFPHRSSTTGKKKKIGSAKTILLK